MIDHYMSWSWTEIVDGVKFPCREEVIFQDWDQESEELCYVEV
jgi:hypothetical protein